MTMTQEELNEKIELHKKWLNDVRGGVKLCLSGATLSFADLSFADLRFADLRGATLRGADLSFADLRFADLRFADLRGATLRGADLRDADLRDADLRGADIDHSCWALSCKTLKVKIDKRIACQLLYHTIRAMKSVDDEECKSIFSNEAVIALANKFHRVEECGRIVNLEAK